jgi:hypothetical protein
MKNGLLVYNGFCGLFTFNEKIGSGCSECRERDTVGLRPFDTRCMSCETIISRQIENTGCSVPEASGLWSLEYYKVSFLLLMIFMILLLVFILFTKLVERIFTKPPRNLSNTEIALEIIR